MLKDFSTCGSATDETPNGDPEECDHLFNGGENIDSHLSFSSPPQSSHSSPVKQKPPAVSKKPQISFIHGRLERDATSPTQAEDRTDARPLPAAEEEEDDESELHLRASAASPVEPAAASQDARLSNGPCVNGETLEEEAEDDGNSSVAESLSSREDDNGTSH